MRSVRDSFLLLLRSTRAPKCKVLIHIGKVTHVRDTVDVQDLIEAVVPFAKRLGWLTRRVTGIMTGIVGGAVLSWVMPKEMIQRIAVPVEAGINGECQALCKECQYVIYS